MESEDSFMESTAFFYLYMTFGDANQVLRYKWRVAVPAEPPADHNPGLTEKNRGQPVTHKTPFSSRGLAKSTHLTGQSTHLALKQPQGLWRVFLPTCPSSLCLGPMGPCLQDTLPNSCSSCSKDELHLAVIPSCS